jgi:hypothetical protein
MKDAWATSATTASPGAMTSGKETDATALGSLVFSEHVEQPVVTTGKNSKK